MVGAPIAGRARGDTMKRLLLLAMLLVGCAATPAQPTPQTITVVITPGPVEQPTPQIVYVTPEPTIPVPTPSPQIVLVPQIVYVTPAPTVAPTPTLPPLPTLPPTPTPTPAPVDTPAPVTFAKVSSRTWAQIVKSPDSYLGNRYQVWACITQFDAATGPGAFLTNASYQRERYWFNGNPAFFNGAEAALAAFVKDDIVFMSVIGAGSFSYDTQAGGNTTVPLFQVVHISRKGSCK